MNKKLIHILIYFLLFCAIMYFMADFTWGSLEKSQTDSTTIDEAIDAKITAHNNDPDAHLGDGQSLQSHRASEIIDHLAESIVPDKSNSGNKWLNIPTNADNDIYFENASSYYVGLFPSMYENSPSTGDAYSHLQNYAFTDFAVSSKDFIFDFVFSLLGSTGTKTASFICQFARIDLKDGYYRIGTYNGSWVYSSWIAYTQKEFQRWRIYYSAIDNTIYFFLQGNQIASVVQTPVFASSDYLIDVLLNRGTSTNSFINFGNIDVGYSSS